jgi:hypothetical protein
MITVPSKAQQDLSKSQVMQSQRYSISKEPANAITNKKIPVVKNTPKASDGRGLSSSLSQKDLKIKDNKPKQEQRP